MESGLHYPVLLIPKQCLSLVNFTSGSEVTENVGLDLDITSVDSEGNDTCVYSGFCNLKVVDGANQPQPNCTIDNSTPVIIADPGFDSNQSQVWIDPEQSSRVYNHYEKDPEEHYTIRRQTKTSRVTYERLGPYIRKNVYNFQASIRYSQVEGRGHKKFNIIHDSKNLDDELECGVFLSQLSERILSKEEQKAREELRFVKSHNDALNQLMSPGIQSLAKQTKTILFLGQDSKCGQTVYNIAVNDPSIKCSTNNFDVIFEDFRNNPNSKKYQCNNCKQIFDRLAEFKRHITDMNSQSRQPRPSCPDIIDSEVDFFCIDCGRRMKTREKFERHCKGHGNPELECNICHKVMASKFTLRTHKQIHAREYRCRFCFNSYSRQDELQAHTSRVHANFCCEKCDLYFDKCEEYESHMLGHNTTITVEDNDTMDTEFTGSYADELSEKDLILPVPAHLGAIEEIETEEVDDKSQIELQEDKPTDVIAKVFANEMFRSGKPNKAGRRRPSINKSCEVCFKHFDRIGDLKRHLIEHVVRSTLNKNPVNKDGTLKITCEVCQAETFHKIDKYKAHLREHAKLTQYKCTFCDKSFSDSSNFSKHKKVHGVDYLQCDLCQRKFNSKRMLALHMEYHNQNPPLPCAFCNKVFHFESTLNKHIRTAHNKEYYPKFRCKFCLEYFSSLKKKWDHEWKVHKVRKIIADCLVCGTKFRKYSDMKRHCTKVHDMDIPNAKKMLGKS